MCCRSHSVRYDVLQESLHERKNYMKEKDMERMQNEKLNDLEEEEREKSDHLKAKAIFMLQEQEDEIKHLNEVRHLQLSCSQQC